ncbi:precorrin-6y C5,15-methyltransferase (decarboxylating) subunit CbiE [Actinomadura bangladeshensis]|uniref:Precorrin-6y C5,15-methyltransferase (Decarboxylating) subunit CbiE n=1 Tax=Actinomadura bangladeshensis TaxID=453573 RepID=A0A4R4NXN0_9ACTN|nr:precorrin-6y C5,15-methyltransferase (decarboxylating) subunit CbiE [Actinomadura bangladeshensis]TDC13884.1 precorrin-6y C5,15-methyltransferase (decarboxylating) subunit CbiE [Actinomadura bangladeshensis]
MLTVVGCDGSPLPEAAQVALESAALVVGEPALLERLPLAPDAGKVAATDVVEALRGVDVTEQDVVVVVDGDPGYFGIVRELLEQGHAPEAIPATPLVARAFAQAGLPWEDALVVSARGGHLRHAVNACRAHPKVAVLTGPGAGPAELARALFPVTPRSFVVCEDLGGPRERVVYVRPAEATTRPWNNPGVVLVLDNRHALGETGWFAGPRRAPAGWALPEDAFGDGPGMRPDVRAFVLAKLGPGIGDMVWDVESGDGSVGIECARFGAAVVAIDRDYAACRRIRENVRLHAAKVAMASGDVQSAAGHLPAPDAVFVGRGGPAAVRVCAQLRPSRLVALCTPADVRVILGILDEQGFTPGAVQLQATRLTPPEEPGDPVIVVWGERDAPAPVRRPSRTDRPIETIPAPPGEPVEPAEPRRATPADPDVPPRKA